MKQWLKITIRNWKDTIYDSILVRKHTMVRHIRWFQMSNAVRFASWLRKIDPNEPMRDWFAEHLTQMLDLRARNFEFFEVFQVNTKLARLYSLTDDWFRIAHFDLGTISRKLRYKLCVTNTDRFDGNMNIIFRTSDRCQHGNEIVPIWPYTYEILCCQQL